MNSLLKLFRFGRLYLSSKWEQWIESNKSSASSNSNYTADPKLTPEIDFHIYFPKMSLHPKY